MDMRALYLGLLFFLVVSTGSFAGDEDYSKLDDIDYSKFARAERTQVAKCFSDLLTVVQGHGLREELRGFLEAGCKAEMQHYKDALGLALQSEPEVQRYNFSEFMMSYLTGQIASDFISSMVSKAVELYREQPLSFCNGASCPLEQYHKCLLLRATEEVTNRTEPRDFENIAREKCKATESEARVALTIDFANVQKHQKDPELSGKTRDLINEVITDIRHETVISYAEDLARVETGRRSCKLEKSVIATDRFRGEGEYRCAIGDSIR
jgi:hypothetical protein